MYQNFIASAPLYDRQRESIQEHVARVGHALHDRKDDLAENGLLWLYVDAPEIYLPASERREQAIAAIRLIDFLQSPVSLGPIRDERDKAWLAALVDGEGCIYIHRQKSKHARNQGYHSRLKISMTDPECVQRCVEITGYGIQSPIRKPPCAKHRKGWTEWVITGANCSSVIADIYPYLLIKRKQAVVAWTLEEIRARMPMGGNRNVHPDALKYRESCAVISRQLNAREAVCLPSWMESPEVDMKPGWVLQQEIAIGNHCGAVSFDCFAASETCDKLYLFSKTENVFVGDEIPWGQCNDKRSAMSALSRFGEVLDPLTGNRPMVMDFAGHR